MNLPALLAAGIATLGLDISPEARLRLLEHLALVQKWNRVHNLTAMRDPEMMLTGHVLDSLAVVPCITGPRIVDIGAGGGFPGIPLALSHPGWHVTLVESSHKKAAFLQQARIDLQLKNVEVVNSRAGRLCRSGRTPRSSPGWQAGGHERRVSSRGTAPLAGSFCCRGHPAHHGSRSCGGTASGDNQGARAFVGQP
jgi:hypothetical protein